MIIREQYIRDYAMWPHIKEKDLLGEDLGLSGESAYRENVSI